MKVLSTLAFAALMAGMAGPVPPPASVDPAADATLAFGLDLLRQAKTARENVFLSPYSVSTALAMARAGARNETARQMDATLHFGDGVAPAAHRALAGALAPRRVRDGWGRDAKEVPAFELETANALWLQESLGVEKPFLATLDGEFGAAARRIDFREAAAARARINGWVEKQTRQRIQNIVPEGLPLPDTQVVLANAIYFKAAWSQPFKESLTRAGPFHVADGKTVPARFMRRTETFRHFENAEACGVELPYRGEETSMVVILPRARDGLPALLRGLTATKLRGWMRDMRQRGLEVALPRFEFTTSVELSRAMKALGMTDAFDGKKADFSGITREEKLFIDLILHKAFIAVDEAGTEAAAATVVIMRKGGRPSGIETFTADHPFLFLIRHRRTGAVLFLGCVEDPTR